MLYLLVISNLWFLTSENKTDKQKKAKNHLGKIVLKLDQSAEVIDNIGKTVNG